MKVSLINKCFFALTFKHLIFFYKHLIFINIVLLTSNQLKVIKTRCLEFEVRYFLFSFNAIKKAFKVEGLKFFKSPLLVLATNNGDLFFNCLLNFDFVFFCFERFFSDLSGVYFYELFQNFNQNFLFVNYYIVLIYIHFIFILYSYILVFVELLKLN
jgi:hypothetical protein